MKIPVIFIAVVAAVGASRPPRAYDADIYRKFPSYVEAPSLPTFLRSPSRHESSPTFFTRPQSFGDDDSEIFAEGPPSRPPYREGRIFLADSAISSSYFPPSRPLSFRWKGPTDFREGQVITYEYKGPPPPVPKDSKKQSLGTVEKKPSTDSSNDLRAVKSKEEPSNQHHQQQVEQQHQHQQQPVGHQHQQQQFEHQYHQQLGHQHQQQQFEHQHHQQQVRHQHQPLEFEQQPYHHHQYHQQQHQHHQHQTFAEKRQPLSFGGHSNHLTFGNHALGFASVAGTTSADINPLAVAQNTATTKAASATVALASSSASTIPMQPSSTSDLKVSQQQQQQNPASYVSPTSAAATSSSQKIAAGAASSQPAESTPIDLASTTPSTTSKNPSDTLKHTTDHRMNSDSYYESPKASYDFRTVTQELPSPMHGLLPIESDKQQLSNVKQSVYFYDTKGGYAFANQPLQVQLGQQLDVQSGNNNVSPVRFSIPTAPISTGEATGQVKLAFPAQDFARSSLTLSAVPNTYSSGQSQVDAVQLKLNPTVNNAPSNNPAYFLIQPQEPAKSAPPMVTNVPLGSFYLLPNTAEAKQPIQQPMQINQAVSPGLQLQLSGYGGIEYLMSPSNSEQMYQPAESMLTKIGFAQNLW